MVTLKYSSSTAPSQSQEQEQWIPITYSNSKDQNSKALIQSLICKSQENKITFDYSQEEFINRLIDNVQIQAQDNKNLLVPKLEKI